MTGAGCVPGGWTTADLPAGAPLGVAVALMLGCWKGDRSGEGRRRVRGAETRGWRLCPRARQVTPRRVTAPGARPPSRTFKSRRSPGWTLLWRTGQ